MKFFSFSLSRLLLSSALVTTAMVNFAPSTWSTTELTEELKPNLAAGPTTLDLPTTEKEALDLQEPTPSTTTPMQEVKVEEQKVTAASPSTGGLLSWLWGSKATPAASSQPVEEKKAETPSTTSETQASPVPTENTETPQEPVGVTPTTTPEVQTSSVVEEPQKQDAAGTTPTTELNTEEPKTTAATPTVQSDNRWWITRLWDHCFSKKNAQQTPTDPPLTEEQKKDADNIRKGLGLILNKDPNDITKDEVKGLGQQLETYAYMTGQKSLENTQDLNTQKLGESIFKFVGSFPSPQPQASTLPTQDLMEQAEDSMIQLGQELKQNLDPTKKQKLLEALGELVGDKPQASELNTAPSHPLQAKDSSEDSLAIPHVPSPTVESLPSLQKEDASTVQPEKAVKKKKSKKKNKGKK